MSINATMKVAEIEALASTLASQREALSAQVNHLIAQANRGDAFTGNAADMYDQYLAKIRSGLESMLVGIQGASDLLTRYAQALGELEGQVSSGFNV